MAIISQFRVISRIATMVITQKKQVKNVDNVAEKAVTMSTKRRHVQDVLEKDTF